uniref:Uncharacterized protein n=1 Tax=Physcomitrium patens TaxID=3218 RepID=A0A2K1JZG7_PHYPA|nr:hypothetical protein PHYPA_014030 [Physcomitrium patens]
MADMCVTCGMPPKNKDDTIPITLLYSRASKQVVCLEVGKEFVDMLMGFLTLPISCLVRVLAEASMIHKPDEIKSPPIVPASVSNNLAPMKSDPHFALSAISNVFESVVKMKNDKMAVDKRTLLQAQPTFPFGAGKLLKTKSTPTKSEEMVHPDSGFYNCGVACNYATAIIQTTCPKHKQPMITAIKMVEESPVESTVKKTTEAAGSVQGRISTKSRNPSRCSTVAASSWLREARDEVHGFDAAESLFLIDECAERRVWQILLRREAQQLLSYCTRGLAIGCGFYTNACPVDDNVQCLWIMVSLSSLAVRTNLAANAREWESHLKPPGEELEPDGGCLKEGWSSEPLQFLRGCRICRESSYSLHSASSPTPRIWRFGRPPGSISKKSKGELQDASNTEVKDTALDGYTKAHAIVDIEVLRTISQVDIG